MKTVKAVTDIRMQYGYEKLRADSFDAIEKVKVSSDGTWQRVGDASVTL